MAAVHSVEYQVVWRWASDEAYRRRVDTVMATTAPRAMSKVIKMLEDEYSNVRQDLRVIAVIPAEF